MLKIMIIRAIIRMNRILLFIRTKVTKIIIMRLTMMVRMILMITIILLVIIERRKVWQE